MQNKDNQAVKGNKHETVIIDSSRGVEIKKDICGNTIRSYDGINMEEVYKKKSFIYKGIKRVFDIVVSGFTLVLLSPVFLGLAIAIKREDGGPVIYSGQRWGKDFK